MSRRAVLLLLFLLDATGPALAQSSPETLEGRRWVLAAWNGAPFAAVQGSVPYFALHQGRAEGGVICNTFFAPVELGAGTIRFVRPGLVTRRGCPGEPGRVENRFIAALGSVERYALAGDRLTLEGPGGLALEFRPAPPP